MNPVRNTLLVFRTVALRIGLANNDAPVLTPAGGILYRWGVDPSPAVGGC